MTVAREIADYAAGFDYKDLPGEVVGMAKRVLLDTLGCAIGGYPSDASQITQGLIKELGGAPESTVIGSGIRTDCLNAALTNGIMVRYLDYMDQISIPVGHWYVYAHPSEVIPGILAVAERQHLSGVEVLTAVVLGYELSARFCEATTIVPIAKKGWNPDSLGVYIMPAVAGKILGLNADQIENAIGVSGCHGMVLGILDSASEEYTMAKNMRFPLTARDGILAALLAQRGFTGPTRVMEGENGFIESVMDGDFDVDKLTDFGGRFRILDTEFKAWAACGTLQGHLNATLNLVEEHGINPEDVAQVRIWAGTRSVEHTGDPVKRYPKNKETADHSAYYVTAVAIKERGLGPDQYSPEKYADPAIRELIDKVTLEIDTDLDRFGRAGITEITTRQGARYRCQIDYPRGHPNNPMTDDDIRNKFHSLAARFMDEERMGKVIGTINALEEVDDIGRLMRLLVFQG
ncbi:MAG: MmgE/PrpD family protein [Dehalococcoidales bacterium]|nr:MmgE/PrpD family protein [Dehalococcoidales bacterium]